MLIFTKTKTEKDGEEQLLFKTYIEAVISKSDEETEWDGVQVSLDYIERLVVQNFPSCPKYAREQLLSFGPNSLLCLYERVFT